MKRGRYLQLSIEYFRGKIAISQLMDTINQEVLLEVDRISLPDNERVMFIANHPAADGTLHLPSDEIADLKGGNTRNFPDFWFPIVRQTMLREALGRKFVTVAFDIGWKVAMQEMNHLLIRPNGNGRCKEVISRAKGREDSLVVFPEGGSRDLVIFRTGFFHIACELGIKYLVLGAFSPALSLSKRNVLKIVHIVHMENMDSFIKPVYHFVEEQRKRIKSAVA